MTIPHIEPQSQGGEVRVATAHHNSDKELLAAHEEAREFVTSEGSVIPIAKYLLNHWYQWLDPSDLMLVIGVRQAAFLPQKSDETIKVDEIRLEKIGYWCGFSKAFIAKRLSAIQNSYLQWFFQIKKEGRNRSYKFAVRIGYPLAPHHINALEHAVRYFIAKWKASNSKGEALDFLRYFEKQIPNESTLMGFYKKEKIIPSNTGYPGLADILRIHFQNFPLEAEIACRNFENRIILPRDTFVISHYFIKYWLPKMTSQEAIWLNILRLRANSNQNVGTVGFSSIREFASLVGADPRTARRFLDNTRDPNKPISYFLTADIDNEDRSSQIQFSIAVSMIDPIHPDHRDIYERLVQMALEGIPFEFLDINLGGDKKKARKTRFTPARYAGQRDKAAAQNVYIRIANGSHFDSKKSTLAEQNVDTDIAKGLHPDSKMLTPDEQNVDTDIAKGLHPDSKMFTEDGQNVDTLIKFESSSLNHKSSNHIQQPPQSTEGESTTDAVAVVVINGWNVTKILTWGGAGNSRDGKRTLKTISENPSLGANFIAWWLWAYTRRDIHRNGKGINSPEWYALRKYEEPCDPRFLRIASIHPLDFYEDYFRPWHLSGGNDSTLKQVASILKEKEFTEVLTALVEEYQEDEEYSDDLDLVEDEYGDG